MFSGSGNAGGDSPEIPDFTTGSFRTENHKLIQPWGEFRQIFFLTIFSLQILCLAAIIANEGLHLVVLLGLRNRERRLLRRIEDLCVGSTSSEEGDELR